MLSMILVLGFFISLIWLIIAIIRRKYRMLAFLSAITCFVILMLISPGPQEKEKLNDYTITESKPEISIEDCFNIKVNKFYIEYGYYRVVGEITNISQNIYKFVLLKADFYDKDGNVVGTDETYACGNDYILPNRKKSFKFMGKMQPDYKSVRVYIINATKVK